MELTPVDAMTDFIISTIKEAVTTQTKDLNDEQLADYILNFLLKVGFSKKDVARYNKHMFVLMYPSVTKKLADRVKERGEKQ